MKRALLGLAATAAVVTAAAPAQAQDLMAFSPGASSPHSGFGASRDDHRRGDRHHRGRHRGGRDVVIPWGWDDGAWALYNNRTWQPESYNDWWHDRPDRAFPRWVRNNDNCERLWWSGGGWRC